MLADTLQQTWPAGPCAAFLIAQAAFPAEVPPWFTMIIQGGSFVALVFWIFVRQPADNKAIREEREARDKLFSAALEKQTGELKAALGGICKK